MAARTIDGIAVPRLRFEKLPGAWSPGCDDPHNEAFVGASEKKEEAPSTARGGGLSFRPPLHRGPPHVLRLEEKKVTVGASTAPQQMLAPPSFARPPLLRQGVRRGSVLLRAAKPVATRPTARPDCWKALIQFLPEAERKTVRQLLDEGPTNSWCARALAGEFTLDRTEINVMITHRAAQYCEGVKHAQRVVFEHFKTLKTCGWMRGKETPGMYSNKVSASPMPWVVLWNPQLIEDVHRIFPVLNDVKSAV